MILETKPLLRLEKTLKHSLQYAKVLTDSCINISTTYTQHYIQHSSLPYQRSVIQLKK